MIRQTLNKYDLFERQHFLNNFLRTDDTKVEMFTHNTQTHHSKSTTKWLKKEKRIKVFKSGLRPDINLYGIMWENNHLDLKLFPQAVAYHRFFHTDF